MPRHRQRDPQPGHPQGTQPAEAEREADRPRFPGETGNAVDRIAAGYLSGDIIWCGKSGNQGISPRRQPS
jgi:hypothetical protein